MNVIQNLGTQAQTVSFGKREKTHLHTIHKRKGSIGRNHGKGLCADGEAVALVFDPTFLGGPQVKKGAVILLGEKGILQRMEEAAGKLFRGGMGAVDLKIKADRPVRKGTQPPVSAVGDGEMEVGVPDKKRLSPGVGFDRPQLFGAESGIRLCGC